MASKDLITEVFYFVRSSNTQCSGQPDLFLVPRRRRPERVERQIYPGSYIRQFVPVFMEKEVVSRDINRQLEGKRKTPYLRS